MPSTVGRRFPWPSWKRDSTSTLHRPVGETVARRSAVVLFGQQGGRHQHGDLLAVGHRATKAARSADFGLAEAHVAAHQPVHRAGRRSCLGSTASMAACWSGVSSNAEAVGERPRSRSAVEIESAGLRAPARWRIDRPAARPQTSRTCSAGLALAPSSHWLGAQLSAAARLRRIGAGVAGDQVQLRHRHVQPVLPLAYSRSRGIPARPAAGMSSVDQAAVAADAVVARGRSGAPSLSSPRSLMIASAFAGRYCGDGGAAGWRARGTAAVSVSDGQCRLGHGEAVLERRARRSRSRSSPEANDGQSASA